MKPNELITVDADILGGTPVFKGTRVPVKTLFEYLENNYTLDEFLECFPSVTRAHARHVLESSESALVTQGVKIPPGSLVLGAPAKVVRQLTKEERAGLKWWAQKYVDNGAYCLKHGLNVGQPLAT